MSDRGRFFLDTNIVVYSLDERFPAKRARARELLQEAHVTRRGMVSYQVLGEFLNVASHTFASPMPPTEAAAFLSDLLEPICSVHSSAGLMASALDLRERWQFRLYDALIVAAALEGRCRWLYSEDFQDGLKVRDLTIRDPFVDAK